ncbi:porin [Citrobacter portucalensis]|uniref:porin n=1 Tax=Citrobacter portucalensis TaxID=1639133 RepID=UPI001C6440BF|nr:porin [Citrobacter portucalensis]MBW7619533.1 porin [Citrobacter portucalensis]MBW7638853.1 porin [Citrobacter portucalensis]MCA2132979.1 porin [Citrobacter portucalensis]MCA2143157.1 porin [Citrobacter portucalensis]MCA2148253.1 porin [Citrobacter portucalensis]
MKKYMLGILISSLILSTSVKAAEIYNKNGNKLDFYGFINGSHYITDDNNVSGDRTFTRFGFKGQTQVSDTLEGYGRWEYQVLGNKAESTNTSFTRYAFAGLRFGGTHSFDYGRNTGILYDAASYTDMQPEFDGFTYSSDQFMFKRGNGIAAYRNSDFFGLVEDLKIAFQYQGKNESGGTEANSRSVLTQNGDGYGASLSYDFDIGISVASAFFSSDRTNDQNNEPGIMGGGAKAEGYTTAIKYSNNKLYLAAMFNRAYNSSKFGSTSSAAYGFANKSQAFELYAHYIFESGFVPFIGYNHLRGYDLGSDRQGNSYDSQNLVKFIDFGFIYNFNKNMQTYIDYKFNLLDDNTFTQNAGISTDHIAAVSLKYAF